MVFLGNILTTPDDPAKVIEHDRASLHTLPYPPLVQRLLTARGIDLW